MGIGQARNFPLTLDLIIVNSRRYNLKQNVFQDEYFKLTERYMQRFCEHYRATFQDYTKTFKYDLAQSFKAQWAF